MSLTILVTLFVGIGMVIGFFVSILFDKYGKTNRDEIKHKLLLKIGKKSFAFFTLSVTMFAILYSIFADVFSDNDDALGCIFTDDIDCHSPSIFNVSELESDHKNFNYTHNFKFLFVLDNSKSTSFRKVMNPKSRRNNILINVREKMVESLLNDFLPTPTRDTKLKKNSPEIKDVLLLGFLKTINRLYSNQNNNHVFSLALISKYDNYEMNFVKNWAFSDPKAPHFQSKVEANGWNDIRRLSRTQDKDFLLKQLADISKYEKMGDETDFGIVFDKIENQYLNNLDPQKARKDIFVITIISDFLNDPEVEMDEVVNKLEKIANRSNIRFNIVILPSYDPIKQEFSFSRNSEVFDTSIKNIIPPQFYKQINVLKLCINYQTEGENGNELYKKLEQVIAPNCILEKEGIKFKYAGRRLQKSESSVLFQGNKTVKATIALRCYDCKSHPKSYFYWEDHNHGKRRLMYEKSYFTELLPSDDNSKLFYENFFSTSYPDTFLEIYQDSLKTNYVVPIKFQKELPPEGKFFIRLALILSALFLIVYLGYLIITGIIRMRR